MGEVSKENAFTSINNGPMVVGTTVQSEIEGDVVAVGKRYPFSGSANYVVRTEIDNL